MKTQTAPESPILRVYLLGVPELWWAGRRIELPRRQTRALLYILAAHAKPVSRQQLAFLLWADIPDAAARRNLTRLLNQLRSNLPDTSLLIAGHERVSLDSNRVWSDVAEFTRRVTEPDSALRLAALQAGIDLYRGSFLAGFELSDRLEFSVWLTQQRQGFERMCLEGLAELVRSYTALGETAAAIACARRSLELDDLDEDIHCRLIELYAAAGNRSASLRQYEECLLILERELGVDPLPETRAAYQAVLDGRRLPPHPVPTRLSWPILPGFNIPIVGRSGALEMLGRAVEAACQSSSGVVLIAGEPGIGKTRLLQELAGRLPAGGQVMLGEAYPTAQTAPFGPVVQALRPALQARLPHLNLAPVWAAEAARLFPELLSSFPGLSPSPDADPERGRARLFEALSQLVFVLVSELPVTLLCLDDLHWADSATLDWLAYLARQLTDRRPRGVRLLIAGAYNSLEADGVASLHQRLVRLGLLAELRLEGLGVDDVACLLRHLQQQPDELGNVLQKMLALTPELPGPAAALPGLAACLQEASGGNPFFLLEILRALPESGLPAGSLPDLAELLLPDSLRRSIGRRLDRLSPVARQVLEAGAVLGPGFDLDWVRLTAGRREMETIDALDELVARQLLVDETGRYRFQHNLVQALVLRQESAGRRQLLHRRAAHALQRLCPGEVAALAWHFEQAHEPVQAARYAIQAGQTASRVFAYTEARANFDRALALLDAQAANPFGKQDLHLRIQALEGRCWVHRLLGSMAAYSQDLERIARLANLLGDLSTVARLRWREAHTHRWFCRYLQALQAAQEGVGFSQRSGDRLTEALCWRELGLAARATGDWDRARAALQHALDDFVVSGETVYEVHVLCNLSTLYYRTGKPDLAAELARQALTRCDQAALPLERRLPLGDLGAAAASLGQADSARDCLHESLALARQTADRTQAIFCLGHLGWLEVMLGRPAPAESHLSEALKLAKEVDSHGEESWLLSGLADALRLSGNPISALQTARRALALAETRSQPFEASLARAVLARL